MTLEHLRPELATIMLLLCPLPADRPSLTLTVAVTGASGSIFVRHLLDSLDRDERVGTVNLSSPTADCA